MSFDIDPEDRYKRILCHHPESGSLFEVFSMAAFANCCQCDPVDDVTDIEEYENLFKLQKKETL